MVFIRLRYDGFMAEGADANYIGLKEKTELAQNRLELKLTQKDRFVGDGPTKYGWADLMLGLPDGEVMDRIMARIRDRVGEETDILESLHKARINIFSRLDEEKVGRDVDFEVSSEKDDKRGGYASSVKRKAVVIAPNGIDSRSYLEWALSGDERDIWNHLAAYHETVHTAKFPEVSGDEANRLLLMRIAVYASGCLTGAGKLISAGEEAPEVQLALWGGMIVGSLVVAFSKSESEKKWDKYVGERDFYSSTIDEIGAQISPEDVGLMEPIRAERLIQMLKNHELYKDDWENMRIAERPKMVEELDKLLAETREIRVVDPAKFKKVVSVVVRKKQISSEINKITAREWREAIAELKVNDGIRVPAYLQENDMNQMRGESAVWRYLERDPKKPEEGGSWGEEFFLKKEAIEELVEAEVDDAMFQVVRLLRAGDAVGLSKYDMATELAKTMRKVEGKQPRSVYHWLRAMEKVVSDRLLILGRSETSITILADESELRAKNRHAELRAIILEELEREWTEGDIEISGRTFDWDNKALYVGKTLKDGERWAAEISCTLSAQGVRLCRFDDKMRMIEGGNNKVVDYDDLEPFVDEVLANMSEDGWKLLEMGLRDTILPGDRHMDDESDGQLQVMFLTKAVDLIPERWGMPEMNELSAWIEYKRELNNALRRHR